ncbi:MAG TPA: hypothetical protein VIL97_01685 [Thermoanaerobaculia bacterium]
MVVIRSSPSSGAAASGEEAHAASVLNHPNVSIIYEVGESDEAIFIAYIEELNVAAFVTGRRSSRASRWIRSSIRSGRIRDSGGF